MFSILILIFNLQRFFLEIPPADPAVVHDAVYDEQPWEWIGTSENGWHHWTLIEDGAALVPVTFT